MCFGMHIYHTCKELKKKTYWNIFRSLDVTQKVYHRILHTFTFPIVTNCKKFGDLEKLEIPNAKKFD